MRTLPLALLSLAAAVPAAGQQAAAPAASSDVRTSAQGGIGSVPASSAEILDAVGDCVRFVKHHGQVDHEGIKAAGWKYAGKQEQPGQGLMPASTKIYLGKDNVIMVLHLTGMSAGCQAVGKITDLVQRDEVRSGIASRFGARPFSDYKGDEAFKAGMARQLKPEQLDSIMISDADRFTVMALEKDGARSLSIMMIPRILD